MPARFSLACLDPAAESAVGRLVADLPQADWYGPDEMAEMFGALRPDSVPHYVLGYAFDALPAETPFWAIFVGLAVSLSVGTGIRPADVVR